jgi:hypothetical protein
VVGARGIGGDLDARVTDPAVKDIGRLAYQLGLLAVG